MGKSNAEWVPAEHDLDWIESASAPIHPTLAAIEAAAAPERVPILDRASGRVLASLSADRRRIIEIGTAYGYSTLWMALAQPHGGTIVTIDPDDGRTAMAREWWREAGIGDARITVVTAPALDAFARDDPALAGPFDLAFIDALKHEYGAYLEALMPRLATNALVVADNVLWSGRVSGARPRSDGDHAAELEAFDRKVLADPRFVSTILPVGDGLLVAARRQ